MPERVAAGVVVVVEALFEGGREEGVGGARVGEVGVAAVVGGWEGGGAEEGEARAAGVEGGVDVEEGVALGGE